MKVGLSKYSPVYGHDYYNSNSHHPICFKEVWVCTTLYLLLANICNLCPLRPSHLVLAGLPTL